MSGVDTVPTLPPAMQAPDALQRWHNRLLELSEKEAVEPSSKQQAKVLADTLAQMGAQLGTIFQFHTDKLISHWLV